METNFFGEIFRFGIVGVIATGIHYGIYLLLNLWLNVNLSYTLGYIISFVCNFYLSNVFTFKTQPTVRKGVGFAFSHAVNYSLQIVLLNIMIFCGIPQKYAPIPVWAISIPLNFILVRFFLKGKKSA